jgi:SAM-dependent methyltransferase
LAGRPAAAYRSVAAIDLSELQRTWNFLGRADPLWAILADPRYEGNRWNVEEFFRLGQAEIDDLFERIGALGVPVIQGRALDFGCGVGRVTQPLCRYFDAVVGVDIAPAMIELAGRFNRFPQRCTYVLNTQDALAAFETASFDFVYSRLVFQHMRPELTERYLAEFFRVLRAGGLAAFQIPGRYSRAERAVAPDPARLPDTAFNAHITVSRPMVLARPLGTVALQLGVQNFGTCVWPGAEGANPMCVGAGWFDQFLRPAGEEATTPLPRETLPGDKTYMTIALQAPAQPGFYLLRLDIVQRGVARGSERGSGTPYVAVAVYEDTEHERATELLPFNAQMEYHGMARPEVEALVERCGAQLLAAFDDAATNAEWPGHLYVARKR